ncbi:DUF4767 domain-containing protein [Lactobacillus amylovorus]|nr:DUF4767 domain-containing protein [Lactobacillus amylovorus]
MVYLTVQSGKSSNSASEVATSKTVSKNKHKGSSTSSSSSSQSSSSKESSSDDQSSKFAQSGWSSDQKAQLASFMNRFGTKMKQKYKEYNGQESIETLAGEKYPDDFKMYSDNSKKTETINIGWDPSLKKDYDYHVVSIFNCNVGNPEQHITYLFSVHDGQPVALVDQTTNGSDCMVKETANQEVRTAFANIFEGNN